MACARIVLQTMFGSSNVASYTNELLHNGEITGNEKGEIQSSMASGKNNGKANGKNK